jgi:hypothetical protein
MKGKHLRRNLLIAVLAVVLLGGLDPVSAQPVVKIGMIPAESAAPFMLAHEKGYFKAQRITTELVRLTSGAAILTQVSTGDLQVGNGALGAAGFNAAHQKLPVAFVAPNHFTHISGISAWREPANLAIIHKHTRVPVEVLQKTRPPFFDQNLELEDKVMMDQQEFNLRLGYKAAEDNKGLTMGLGLHYNDMSLDFSSGMGNEVYNATLLAFSYKFSGITIKEYRKKINYRDPEPQKSAPAKAARQPSRQEQTPARQDRKPAKDAPEKKKDSDFFWIY